MKILSSYHITSYYYDKLEFGLKLYVDWFGANCHQEQFF